MMHSQSIVLTWLLVIAVSTDATKYKNVKELSEKDVVGQSKCIVLFTTANDTDNLKALDEAAAHLPSGVRSRYVLVKTTIDEALNTPELESVKTLFADVDQLPFVDYVITASLPANLTANFTFGRKVEHLNATEIPDTFSKVNTIGDETFELYTKIKDIQKLAKADSLNEEELAPIYAQFFKITSGSIEKLAQLSAQLNKNGTTKSNQKQKRSTLSFKFCSRLQNVGTLCV
ncbi:unnamed protein product [Anisakis simplex]|uniref:Uncharacterized protein n=1 Tax=Anisakis simplex TaxID=6269 RepID=A0A0M3JYS8_ANISI|nr:unnamed protein product [Anisakis simplex]